MSNIEFPQQSFNSQLLNNKDIPRESGDTVSIIEKTTASPNGLVVVKSCGLRFSGINP